MSDLSVADVLERAADLLTTEGAWAQGEWETDLGCLCAEGALWKAGAAPIPSAVSGSPAGSVLEEIVGGSIVDWNDAPDRTQAEVVSKLRYAALVARERSA